MSGMRQEFKMKSTAAFIPEEYDKKIKHTLPSCEEFYKQIADVVKCLYTEKVSWLDVGCGTGKMEQDLSHRRVTTSI